MSSDRPTRATSDGRAYLDLQSLARKTGRSTDDLMRLYALEGLLARLAVSRHAAQLVLKGGVLLAAYGARRATRDIDLQARQVTNELGTVLTVIREIAGITIDDGLTYATEAAAAHTIRQDNAYQGVRVALTCSLVSARISLHVDVNVGDPIGRTAGDHHPRLARTRRHSHRISAGDGPRGEDRHGSRARTSHDAVA